MLEKGSAVAHTKTNKHIEANVRGPTPGALAEKLWPVFDA